MQDPRPRDPDGAPPRAADGGDPPGYDPPPLEPYQPEEPPQDGALAAVVEIDRRDDVASVCGRIDMAPTYAVVVHAPRGNRVLSTELGMRRLKRHVDDTGKVVAFATRRRGLATRARQVGLAVGPAPHKIRWDAPGRSVFFLPFISRFSLALPNLGRYLRFIVALAVLAALGALAVTAGPSANVTAVPTTVTREASIDLVALLEGAEAPEDVLAVPAEEVSFALVLTLVVPTTGSVVEDVARATAAVSITNTTDEEVVLPAGTVVIAPEGDLRFTIAEETTIAGDATAEGVLAVAAERGSAHNVAAGAITAFEADAPAGLTVTNPAAATGGLSEQSPAVAEADIEALRAQESSILSSTAFEAELNSLYRDDLVFTDSATLEGEELDEVPPVGAPVDLIVMQYQVAVSAVAIPRERLESLAADALELEDGEELIPESVVGRFARVTYDRGNRQYTANITLTGEASEVTSDDLRDAVTGRSEADAKAALLDVDGVEAGDVELTPGWAPWLPRFGFRVDVDLELPEEAAATED